MVNIYIIYMLKFLKKDYKKYLTYVIVILLAIIILYTFNYFFNKEKFKNIFLKTLLLSLKM